MLANAIVRTTLRKFLVLLPVVLAAFAAPNLIAQHNGAASASPMAPMAADAHPSFEVATINPADPNRTSGGGFTIGGHRLVIEGQTVNDLISFAYAVHPKQIADAPAWLGTEKFDIDGQADQPGVPTSTRFRRCCKSSSNPGSTSSCIAKNATSPSMPSSWRREAQR